MTDVWLTPPAIIEALGGAESFDLDPCAEDRSPVATAKATYTASSNGLLLPWFGRIWLNPPYSILLLTRFLARMATHDHGTALIFSKTDTDSFHRYVLSAATGLLFIRGRLRFHLPDGTRARKDAGAPSVLVAYGQEDCEILAAAPIEGQFVPLRVPTSILVVIPETRSWADVLAEFFAGIDGPIALADLYRALAGHPRTATNRHWQDKVRQVLQLGEYQRVDRGVWQRRAA